MILNKENFLDAVVGDKKAWIICLLKNNSDVLVKFTKIDGTIRNMHCTLKEGKCPAWIKENELDIIRVQKDPIIRRITVWDLEKQDWRSFRIDSIEQITIGTEI